MTERELLAVMAAALYHTATNRGLMSKAEHAVSDAEHILMAVDRRLEQRAGSPQEADREHR